MTPELVRRVLYLAGILLLAGACANGEPASEPTPTPEGPYVVTAVDYHFHDAHPSKPIPLDRAVEFSSQGNNIHNVTFPGTDYDENLRTGDRIRVAPIGSLLEEPGRYRFICRFHADRGMTGVLVIVDPSET